MGSKKFTGLWKFDVTQSIEELIDQNKSAILPLHDKQRSGSNSSQFSQMDNEIEDGDFEDPFRDVESVRGSFHSVRDRDSFHSTVFPKAKTSNIQSLKTVGNGGNDNDDDDISMASSKVMSSKMPDFEVERAAVPHPPPSSFSHTLSHFGHPDDTPIYDEPDQFADRDQNFDQTIIDQPSNENTNSENSSNELQTTTPKNAHMFSDADVDMVLGNGIIFYTNNAHYEGEYVVCDGKKLRHGTGVLYLGTEKRGGTWDFGTLLDNTEEETNNDRISRRSFARASLAEDMDYEERWKAYITRVKSNETSQNYFQSRTSEYKPLKEFQIKSERYQVALDDVRFEILVSFDETKFAVLRTSEEIKTLCTSLMDKHRQTSLPASTNLLNAFNLSDGGGKLKQVTSALNKYFINLLENKEILLSPDLHLFLDPELVSLKDHKDHILLEPECVHSILLDGYSRETKTVKKNFTKLYKVEATEYLIWSFTTANYDIGFSIEMDGLVQVPMIRYKARDGIVMGALEAIADGQCTLKWDNSYSKLRSKQLTWCARIVPKSEFESASSEKRKFDEIRRGMKIAITSAANSLPTLPESKPNSNNPSPTKDVVPPVVGKGTIEISENRYYNGEYIIVDGKMLRHGTGIYTIGKKHYSGVWEYDMTQKIDELPNDAIVDVPNPYETDISLASRGGAIAASDDRRITHAHTSTFLNDHGKVSSKIDFSGSNFPGSSFQQKIEEEEEEGGEDEIIDNQSVGGYSVQSAPQSLRDSPKLSMPDDDDQSAEGRYSAAVIKPRVSFSIPNNNNSSFTSQMPMTTISVNNQGGAFSSSRISESLSMAFSQSPSLEGSPSMHTIDDIIAPERLSHPRKPGTLNNILESREIQTQTSGRMTFGSNNISSGIGSRGIPNPVPSSDESFGSKTGRSQLTTLQSAFADFDQAKSQHSLSAGIPRGESSQDNSFHHLTEISDEISIASLEKSLRGSLNSHGSKQSNSSRRGDKQTTTSPGVITEVGNGLVNFAEDRRFEGDWAVVNGQKVKHGTGIYYIGDKVYSGVWDLDVAVSVVELEYPYKSFKVDSGDSDDETTDDRNDAAEFIKDVQSVMGDDYANTSSDSKISITDFSSVYSSRSRSRQGVQGNGERQIESKSSHSLKGLRLSQKSPMLGATIDISTYDAKLKNLSLSKRLSSDDCDRNSPVLLQGREFSSMDELMSDLSASPLNSFASRFNEDTASIVDKKSDQVENVLRQSQSQSHVSNNNSAGSNSSNVQSKGNGKIVYAGDSYYEGGWININGEKARHGKGTFYVGKKEVHGEWDYGTLVTEAVQEESTSERESRRSFVKNSLPKFEEWKKNQAHVEELQCTLDDISSQYGYPRYSEVRPSEIDMSPLTSGQGLIFYSIDSYYDGSWMIVYGNKLRHGKGELFIGKTSVKGDWDFGELIDDSIKKETPREQELRRSIVRMSLIGEADIGSTMSYNDIVDVMHSNDSNDNDNNNISKQPKTSNEDVEDYRTSLSERKSSPAEGPILTGQGCLFYSKDTFYTGEWIQVEGEKLRHGHGTMVLGKETREGEWDYGTFIDTAVENESPAEREYRRSSIRKSIQSLGQGEERPSAFIVRKSDRNRSSFSQALSIQKDIITNHPYNRVLGLRVFITDYHKLRNDLNFDVYAFDIDVSAGEECDYVVSRTLADFSILHSKLVSTFPDKVIKPLIVDAAALTKETLRKEFSGELQTSRSSNNSGLQGVFDTTMASNICHLAQYIDFIMADPDLIVSDDFLFFLDQEAASMTTDPILLETCVHNLLLANSAWNTQRIKKDFNQIFSLKAGQKLLWSFKTIGKDIGFAIETNGTDQVPLMYHKSHEDIVMGVLEAFKDMESCVLKWVNVEGKKKFSILKTPIQLLWAARVVDSFEYGVAEAMKEKMEANRNFTLNAAIYTASYDSVNKMQSESRNNRSFSKSSSMSSPRIFDISRSLDLPSNIDDSFYSKMFAASLNNPFSSASVSRRQYTPSASASFSFRSKFASDDEGADADDISLSGTSYRSNRDDHSVAITSKHYVKSIIPEIIPRVSHGSSSAGGDSDDESSNGSFDDPFHDVESLDGGHSEDGVMTVTSLKSVIRTEERLVKSDDSLQPKQTSSKNSSLDSIDEMKILNMLTRDERIGSSKSHSKLKSTTDRSYSLRSNNENPPEIINTGSSMSMRSDISKGTEPEGRISKSRSKSQSRSYFIDPYNQQQPSTHSLKSLYSPSRNRVDSFQSASLSRMQLPSQQESSMRMSRKELISDKASLSEFDEIFRESLKESLTAVGDSSPMDVDLESTDDNQFTVGVITENAISALRNSFSNSSMQFLNSADPENALIRKSITSAKSSFGYPSSPGTEASYNKQSQRNVQVSDFNDNWAQRSVMPKASFSSRNENGVAISEGGLSSVRFGNRQMRVRNDITGSFKSSISQVSRVWDSRAYTPSAQSSVSVDFGDNTWHEMGSTAVGRSNRFGGSIRLPAARSDGHESIEDSLLSAFKMQGLEGEGGPATDVEIDEQGDIEGVDYGQTSFSARSVISLRYEKDEEEGLHEGDGPSADTDKERPSEINKELFPSTNTSSNVAKDMSFCISNFCNTGEKTTLDSYSFEIEITLDSLVYVISRTYADFINFDGDIRKKYSRLPIRSLPPPDAIVNEATIIDEVQPQLKDYLINLVSQYQTVASWHFLFFLDPEASSYGVDHLTLDPICVHSVLLPTLSGVGAGRNTAVWTKVTINPSKKYKQYFELQAGQYLLWVFKTVKYDIALGVEVDGLVKMPISRFKSQGHGVMGELEGNKDKGCVVVLTFDNTYSKMRSKDLSWATRIVDADKYAVAHQTKQKYSEQRNVLKTFATTKSKSIMDERGSSSSSFRDFGSRQSGLSSWTQRPTTSGLSEDRDTSSSNSSSHSSNSSSAGDKRSSFNVRKSFSTPLSVINESDAWEPEEEAHVMPGGPDDDDFETMQQLESAEAELDGLRVLNQKLSSDVSNLEEEKDVLLWRLEETLGNLEDANETMNAQASNLLSANMELEQLYLQNVKLSSDFKALADSRDDELFEVQKEMEQMKVLQMSAARSSPSPFEKQNLESDLKVAKMELQYKTAEIDRLAATIDDLKDEKSTILAHLEKLLEKANTSSLESTKEAAASSEKVKLLQKELEFMHIENMNMASVINDQKAEKKALMISFQNSADKLEENLRGYIVNLTDSNLDLNEQIKDMDEELDDMHGQNEKMHSVIQAVEQSNYELQLKFEKEIAGLKKKHVDELNHFRDFSSHNGSEFDMLQKELENLMSQKENLTSLLRESKEEKSTLLVNFSKSLERLDASHSGSLANANQSTKHLTDQVVSLSKELELAHLQNEKLSVIIHDLKEEKSTLILSFDKSFDKLDRSNKNAMLTVKGSTSMASAQLKAAHEEIEQLKLQNGRLHDSVTELKEEKYKLISDHDNAIRILEISHTNEISNAAHSTDSASERVKSVAVELDQVKKLNQQLIFSFTELKNEKSADLMKFEKILAKKQMETKQLSNEATMEKSSFASQIKQKDDYCNSLQEQNEKQLQIIQSFGEEKSSLQYMYEHSLAKIETAHRESLKAAAESNVFVVTQFNNTQNELRKSHERNQDMENAIEDLRDEKNSLRINFEKSLEKLRYTQSIIEKSEASTTTAQLQRQFEDQLAMVIAQKDEIERQRKAEAENIINDLRVRMFSTEEELNEIKNLNQKLLFNITELKNEKGGQLVKFEKAIAKFELNQKEFVSKSSSNESFLQTQLRAITDECRMLKSQNEMNVKTINALNREKADMHLSFEKSLERIDYTHKDAVTAATGSTSFAVEQLKSAQIAVEKANMRNHNLESTIEAMKDERERLLSDFEKSYEKLRNDQKHSSNSNANSSPGSKETEMRYEEMSLPLLAKVSKAETIIRDLEREKNFATQAHADAERRVNEITARNDELKNKLQSMEAELILSRQEQKYFRGEDYTSEIAKETEAKMRKQFESQMKIILKARRNEEERSNVDLNKTLAELQAKLAAATREKGSSDKTRAEVEMDLRKEHEAKIRELTELRIDAIAKAKKDAEAKAKKELEDEMKSLEIQLTDAQQKLKKSEKLKREAEEKLKEQKIILDTRKDLGMIVKRLELQLSEAQEKLVLAENKK